MHNGGKKTGLSIVKIARMALMERLPASGDELAGPIVMPEGVGG